jgi:hypothetical protein
VAHDVCRPEHAALTTACARVVAFCQPRMAYSSAFACLREQCSPCLKTRLLAPQLTPSAAESPRITRALGRHLSTPYRTRKRAKTALAKGLMCLKLCLNLGFYTHSPSRPLEALFPTASYASRARRSLRRCRSSSCSAFIARCALDARDLVVAISGFVHEQEPCHSTAENACCARRRCELV